MAAHFSRRSFMGTAAGAGLGAGLLASEAPRRGDRGYECGLAWQLLQMNRRLGKTHPDWAACARRSLAFMESSAGQAYHGMFARPWSSGLAWLSCCEDAFHGP
jgi:hypothetical protein